MFIFGIIAQLVLTKPFRFPPAWDDSPSIATEIHFSEHTSALRFFGSPTLTNIARRFLHFLVTNCPAYKRGSRSASRFLAAQTSPLLSIDPACTLDTSLGRGRCHRSCRPHRVARVRVGFLHTRGASDSTPAFHDGSDSREDHNGRILTNPLGRIWSKNRRVNSLTSRVISFAALPSA